MGRERKEGKKRGKKRGKEKRERKEGKKRGKEKRERKEGNIPSIDLLGWSTRIGLANIISKRFSSNNTFSLIDESTWRLLNDP